MYKLRTRPLQGVVEGKVFTVEMREGGHSQRHPGDPEQKKKWTEHGQETGPVRKRKEEEEGWRGRQRKCGDQERAKEKSQENA